LLEVHTKNNPINGSLRIENKFAAGGSTHFDHPHGKNYIRGTTILEGGNVGIGTTSPGEKLQVDGGSSKVKSVINTTNTDAHAAVLRLQNSSGTAFNDVIEIGHGAGVTTLKDGNGKVQMAIDVTNARVGIGTASPGFKFVTSADVNDWTAKILNTHNKAYGLSIENTKSTTGYGLAVYTGSGIGFFVQNNGNVGIGKPSPDVALDVNGTIKHGGDLIKSDIRYKADISTITNALDKVLNLRGVNFKWNTEKYQDRNFDDGLEIGLIGQEVEQVVPEVVDTDNHSGFAPNISINTIRILGNISVITYYVYRD